MPWGKGEIVEEATALDEWHEPALQLLRYEDGVSAKTLASLRRALKGAPRLRGLLRKLVAP